MGKPVKKPRKPMQPWKVYEVKGDSLTRKTSSCPKCGKGVYMANHNNRKSCGKCSYTEMSVKKEDKK
jgi:ubiquitin-small subunit ribosomal protein S27Ae